MKTLKFLLLLMLTGSSLQLVSQVNPVSIDLRSNGVKLDAKFYPANKTDEVPTVILLHGFPGNQSSPLGLAEILAAQYIRAGRGVTTFWLKYQVPARCSRLVTQPPHIAWPFVAIS